MEPSPRSDGNTKPRTQPAAQPTTLQWTRRLAATETKRLTLDTDIGASMEPSPRSDGNYRLSRTVVWRVNLASMEPSPRSDGNCPGGAGGAGVGTGFNGAVASQRR